MIFHLIVDKNFTDKHDKSIKYKINEKIEVGLERAVELLSNPNHLVRLEFVENNDSLSNDEKETIIKNFFETSEIDTIISYLNEEVVNKIIENSKNSDINDDKDNSSESDKTLDNGTSNSSKDDSYGKDLATKGFKELQEIAKSKDIDIAGLNTKDKLIAEILKK